MLQACLQLAQQCLRLAAEEGMTGSLQEALRVFATGSSDATSAAGGDASADVAHEPGTTTDAVHSSSSPTYEAVSADAATVPGEELHEAVLEASTTAVPAAAAPAASAAAAWDAARSVAVKAACASRATQHQQDAAALYDNIKRIMDAATAYVLHVSGAVGLLPTVWVLEPTSPSQSICSACKSLKCQSGAPITCSLEGVSC